MSRRSSSAWAKNAAAFFRISLARRSSKFSRSSCLSRCRSSVVRPGRRPWFRSAWRTHFRSVSAVQPIFSAIEVIAAHCESCAASCSTTIRTARSRTSGENRLGLVMAPSSCISRSQPSPKLGRVKVGGSPSSSGSRKTVLELGAPPTVPSSNPNSRLGGHSPHSQGRVMEHPCFIGIDVSKAHLDVYIRPLGESFRVSHDDAGFVMLIARVGPLAPAVLVLEATGGYEVTVAAALVGAGLPVAVVNPRQIRDFARATGQLAKTDALDARIIALFAEAVRPVARSLPDQQARTLGDLVARRRQLVDMLTAEQNRRRLLRDLRLQEHLDSHIAWLGKALGRLEADLKTLIR